MGVIEFRQAVTSHYDGKQLELYDLGRELAHILTLRKFEDV